MKLFFFIPFYWTAQSPLLLNLPDFLIAGTEVENRIELGPRLIGNPKTAQVHRAVDREFFQPQFLRGGTLATRRE